MVRNSAPRSGIGGWKALASNPYFARRAKQENEVHEWKLHSAQIRSARRLHFQGIVFSTNQPQPKDFLVDHLFSLTVQNGWLHFEKKSKIFQPAMPIVCKLFLIRMFHNIFVAASIALMLQKHTFQCKASKFFDSYLVALHCLTWILCRLFYWKSLRANFLMVFRIVKNVRNLTFQVFVAEKKERSNFQNWKKCDLSNPIEKFCARHWRFMKAWRRKILFLQLLVYFPFIVWLILCSGRCTNRY